jgi:16S rRNA (uracil1498-N3)-methyltransferase
MGLHRIHLDSPAPAPNTTLTVEGDEARHAAGVKRLHVGERVEILDGRGQVALGAVEAITTGKRAQLVVRVESVRHEPPVRPMVHVWSATPKGDRVDQMIDQLSQAGAASWSHLHTQRGEVDPRTTKLERLHRIAIEASKQCGRAHVLRIEGPRTIDDLASWLSESPGRAALLADGAGEGVGQVFTHAALANAQEIVLIVGPEGGLSDQEIARTKELGAHAVSFGPHVMRIETAAAIGVGGIMGARAKARAN